MLSNILIEIFYINKNYRILNYISLKRQIKIIKVLKNIKRVFFLFGAMLVYIWNKKFLDLCNKINYFSLNAIIFFYKYV